MLRATPLGRRGEEFCDDIWALFQKRDWKWSKRIIICVKSFVTPLRGFNGILCVKKVNFSKLWNFWYVDLKPLQVSKNEKPLGSIYGKKKFLSVYLFRLCFSTLTISVPFRSYILVLPKNVDQVMLLLLVLLLLLLLLVPARKDGKQFEKWRWVGFAGKTGFRTSVEVGRSWFFYS